MHVVCVELHLEGNVVDPAFSLFNEGFRFLSTERIAPRNHYGVPDSDKVSSKLGVQGEWTPDYLSRHGEEIILKEACAHHGARSLQLAHQVEAWMNEVSPGVQIQFDRDRDLDLIRLSYSFVARSETSGKYRPANLGFGGGAVSKPPGSRNYCGLTAETKLLH